MTRIPAHRPAAMIRTSGAGQAPRKVRAANDNPRRTDEAMLGSALRHFARHGLRAAVVARTNAEAAHAAGDRAGCDHWLVICATLDRRMAIALAARIGRDAL